MLDSGSAEPLGKCQTHMTREAFKVIRSTKSPNKLPSEVVTTLSARSLLLWDPTRPSMTSGSLCQLLLLVVMLDRKSTRLNSSHSGESRMPSSA